MKLIVEIDNEAFEERTITSGDSEFVVREQAAWLQLPGERYPQKITVQLGPNQAAHKTGNYEVAPSSVFVNRYGALAFKRILELQLVADKQAA